MDASGDFCLPVELSYGCDLRAVECGGLYFHRNRREWKAKLSEFLERLTIVDFEGELVGSVVGSSRDLQDAVEHLLGCLLSTVEGYPCPMKEGRPEPEPTTRARVRTATTICLASGLARTTRNRLRHARRGIRKVQLRARRRVRRRAKGRCPPVPTGVREGGRGERRREGRTSRHIRV